MTQFHDVRFPIDIAFGSTGGPQRRTQIVTTASGAEYRNARWIDSRRSYNAGSGIKTFDQLALVVAFFEERRGALHPFRFRDPLDYKSCPPSQTPAPMDQQIAIGDGQTTHYAIRKAYGERQDAYKRPIRLIVEETLKVAINGTEIGSDEFTCDQGQITFTSAPPAGSQISAGFEFDVPVRFQSDELSVNMAKFAAGEIPSVPLIEVRL